MRDKDIRTFYPKIQYNLYRRSFDLATHAFGEEELVYDAASQDKSATLPRVSPDGRYLLFAEGQYGCFHIRHLDGDIVCLPLDSLSIVPTDSLKNLSHADSLSIDSVNVPSRLDLSKLNSEGSPDSYPSWSSNGHWIMVASRRDDGNFCRVYFSYFHDGKVEKAFMLPQEDPEMHISLLKSYNRPEFMVEPVRISVNEFSQVSDK